jgi:NADPH:quinone reductase-like Zn-dependent oxidoreductase
LDVKHEEMMSLTTFVVKQALPPNARSRWHTAEELARFREMIETGAFRPLIARRYPLDRIVEAYRYVETGRKLGNVVITVVPSS